MPNFFHAEKRVTRRGAIFAGIVAVFLWFDAMAGEGVFDFWCARWRCVPWYMPWRERPGLRHYYFLPKRLRKGGDSVEAGNVCAASAGCATGFVSAIRSEFVCSFQRTVEITGGCQALSGAMRVMRRTQLLRL